MVPSCFCLRLFYGASASENSRLPPPAQVFEVRAKTTLLYSVLAFVASLGAMEAGSLARGLLDWPVDVEETANQFDAGSFALPTRFARRWLDALILN